ncbi:MAG: hypothetical protein NZ936_20375, partial [Alphaproteobacteria bacterium]|nr:hypothetical protein [Alphaproteobacteria bacterium]
MGALTGKKSNYEKFKQWNNKMIVKNSAVNSINEKCIVYNRCCQNRVLEWRRCGSWRGYGRC